MATPETMAGNGAAISQAKDLVGAGVLVRKRVPNEEEYFRVGAAIERAQSALRQILNPEVSAGEREAYRTVLRAALTEGAAITRTLSMSSIKKKLEELEGAKQEPDAQEPKGADE